MATASVTHDFVNGNTADADQVDTNFTDLVNFLNADVLHLDGSKAMTAALDMGGFNLTNLSGGWKDFTTLGNGLDLGNGTLIGRYLEIGKLVIFTYALTFGTTTSITSSVALEPRLPVSGTTNMNGSAIGFAEATDLSDSTRRKNGVVIGHHTSELHCRITQPAPDGGYWDSTTPFADGGASGDEISFVVTYEAA